MPTVRTRPIGGGPDADLSLLSNLDLNLLAPLHALLEERNVTRAAVRVGLTQSAMSHVLRRCRRLFGDELLVRVGNSMELSARARDVLVPLAVTLESVRAMVDPTAGFDAATTRRQVTMGSYGASAISLLPRVLGALALQAPNLTLRSVAVPPLNEDLIDRPDLDLILRASIIPLPYPRTAVYTERWVVIADIDNEALADGVSLDQLLSLPHVEYDADSHVMPYRVLEGLGLSWHAAVSVDDFLVIPHLIRGSNRIGIVQERVATEFVRNGGLRMYDFPLDIPPYTVDIVWNPRRNYDPLKPWLTELMRRVMAAPPPTPSRRT